MDMIGKVRRIKWRDQLSDGEIFGRTGLARNTVKKWLNAPGDTPHGADRLTQTERRRFSFTVFLTLR
jgi:hypothetical protein